MDENYLLMQFPPRMRMAVIVTAQVQILLLAMKWKKWKRHVIEHHQTHRRHLLGKGARRMQEPKTMVMSKIMSIRTALQPLGEAAQLKNSDKIFEGRNIRYSPIHRGNKYTLTRFGRNTVIDMIRAISGRI